MSIDADALADLERRMAEAVENQDFEAAARLRDQIAAAKEGPSLFERQTPGRMGLGTDQQVMAPPKGWKPPKKPNLMTSNTKPRRGGR